MKRDDLGAAGSADGALLTLSQVMAIGVMLTLAVSFELRPPDGLRHVANAATAICLIFTGALVGMRLPPRHVSRWIAPIAVLLATFALVALRAANGLAGAWPQITWAAGVAVVVAALLLPPLWAALASLPALAALVLVGWFGTIKDSLATQPIDRAAQLVRVLLVGVIAGATATILRRSARRADSAVAAADAAEGEVAVASAGRAVTANARRTIHDTALNTLEVIARDGEFVDEARLRRRCADDAAALSALILGAPAERDEGGPLRDLPRRGRQLGLVVEDRISYQADPPEPITSALAAAAYEALINVSKHAATDRVTLTGSVAPDGAEVQIRDRGRGFSTAHHEAGHGLGESIGGRMEEIGGTWSVRSRPGAGTTIRLSWSAERATEPHRRLDLSEPMDLVVLVLVLGLAGAGVLAMLAGWRGYERPVIAAATAVVLMAWAAYLLVRLRGPVALSGSEIAATLVLCGWAVVLTPIADPYCTAWASQDVPPDTRLALLSLLVLVSDSVRRLGVVLAAYLAASVVALALWSVVWPGCVQVSVPAIGLGCSLIVAAWVFGRALRAQLATAESAGRRLSRLTTEAMARDAAERTRESWVAPAVASAASLLSDVSRSLLSPRDPGVRSTCRSEARFLRGLIQVPASGQPLDEGLRQVLIDAHARGADVIARGDFAGLRPQVARQGPITRAIGTAMAAARSGSDPVVVYAYASGRTQAISIRVPNNGEVRNALADCEELRRLNDLRTECDADEEEIWVEIEWDLPTDSRLSLAPV